MQGWKDGRVEGCKSASLGDCKGKFLINKRGLLYGFIKQKYVLIL